MEFSGERVVPELEDYQELYFEHIARYHFALQHVPGKRVLDVGCGTGYGSAFLALHGAEFVTGIDISKEAIEYASENFSLRNLQFEVGDATKLSSTLSHVDVCVSFEVLEHVQEDAEFLRRLHLALAPEGICILSTPNKQVSSPDTEIPPNPFHVREYTFAHLQEVLSKEFKYVSIFGQSFGEGFHISDIMSDNTIVGSYQPIGAIPYTSNEGRGRRFNHVGTPRPTEEPLYFVAVCSDVPIESSGMFIGLEAMSTLRTRVRDRESWIQILQAEKATRDERISDLEDTLSSREDWIHRLQIDLGSRDDRIRDLEDTLDSRDHWVKIMQEDIQRRDDRIRDLETTLQGHDKWISDLRTELSLRDELVDSLQQDKSALQNEIDELSIVKTNVLRLEQEADGQASYITELEGKLRARTAELDQILTTWAGRLAKAIVRRGRSR